MPISMPPFVAKATKLSAVAILIFTSPAPLAAQQDDRLGLGYLASFANGSLEPSLDQPGFGPLQEGHSQDADTYPSWTPDGGDLVLAITRPAAQLTGVAAAGVFATPVNFGPGTVFRASATFINPDGPHGSSDIWAVVLGARTGDKDDLFSETRVAATLQVRGTSLRFNSPGGGPGQDLPPEVYAEVFSPTDPQPFTLELVVDRVSGASRVSLKVNDRVFSRQVNFAAFGVASGPAITAVGPSIGISSAPGQAASVHLREFRIFLPSNSSSNTAATCPDTWDAFSCREVPTDQ